MTLGENIVKLRTEKGWTQDDLAERILTSRQSVSKWETNTSVPELEKLLRLSELFQVSLDELVKGTDMWNHASVGSEDADGASADSSDAERASAEGAVCSQAYPTQKVIGFMLFGLGALVLILFSLLGGLFSGLLFSIPLLICAAICFIAKNRAGLWCGWFFCGVIHFGSLYMTGITWKAIFSGWRIGSDNPLKITVAWVYFLFLLGMVAATLVSFQKAKIRRTKKNRIVLLVGWAVLAGLVCIPYIIAGTEWYRRLYQEILSLGFYEINYKYIIHSLFSQLLDAVRLVLFVILLVCTCGYLRGKK